MFRYLAWNITVLATTLATIIGIELATQIHGLF